MVKIKHYKRKISLLKVKSIREYKETAQMFRLLYKEAKTDEERSFIKKQSVDLVKISVVVVIAALPGGTFAVAFIETGLQKINRTILPTSFSKKNVKKSPKPSIC